MAKHIHRPIADRNESVCRAEVGDEAASLVPSPEPAPDIKVPRFAHPSEAKFAAILDFYRLEWQYEPRTFELQWDAEGRPVESFTPDFYLPSLDLYL